jgi:hypothetical protein
MTNLRRASATATIMSPYIPEYRQRPSQLFQFRFFRLSRMARSYGLMRVLPPASPGGGGGTNPKTPGVWIPGHSYGQGDSIIDPYNGHIYISVTPVPNSSSVTPSPRSDALPTDPFSLPTPAPPDEVSDPNASLTWIFDISVSPKACNGNKWATGQMYTTMTYVGPYAAKCYHLKSGSGISGVGNDPFMLATPPQTAQPPDNVREGSVDWKWDGKSSNTACTGNGHDWQPGQPYSGGRIVGPFNGRCYVANGAGGTAGPAPVQPYFPSSQVLTVSDGPDGDAITWQDFGTTPPSAVTGGQAADQTISLLNLQLPQAHTLSYYNLSAGIVYSTLRNRSFGVPPPMAGQTGSTQISTNTEITTSDTVTIDPVLLLTAYPRPVDAESNCRVQMYLQDQSRSKYWTISRIARQQFLCRHQSRTFQEIATGARCQLCEANSEAQSSHPNLRQYNNCSNPAKILDGLF